MQRRTFVAGFATTAASLAAGLSAEPTPAASREQLREFHYSDVTLTGGPLKDHFDRTHAHFLTLNNDRLLKVYRQKAGLPAPGDDMGGWYDAKGFVPGHTLGQYISGLSRMASATGHAPTRQKVHDLVAGFAATLGPDGNPYASPVASTTWPCYVLDKYEAGLLDAYHLAGVTQARQLLGRVVTGALPFIPDHTYDRGPDSPKQAPYDEPYILPETLFYAHESTGEKRYLDMARLYLLDKEYFDPLARGENILPGKHAYSHAIALSSAAKAYLVLGDPKYLQAARNAWDMIETTQQFASGGWGPKEAFVPPGQGKLGESVLTSRDHFETPCGCYAHTKLARYMLRCTANARYGDGLERVLFNTVLGSIDPDDQGNYFYYSDYHAGARKGYYKRKWPCCSGTLIQGVADYLLNLYFHSGAGIWVNFFTPSTVRWHAGRTPVKLIQTTGYPLDETVHLRLEIPAPADFAINVRIPGWLSAEPRLELNGKPLDVPARRQTFASIRRRWKNNDTLTLRLPLAFRTEPIDDRHPTLAALLRGPLLYVATDPPAELASTPLSLPAGLSAVDHNAADFQAQLAGRAQRFKPFYTVRQEPYDTYFSVLPGAR